MAEEDLKSPKDSVRITMRMEENTDLRVSLGWNFSDDLEEIAEENLRYIAEGVMYLLANQIDDLIQIGLNLEENQKEEPFEHDGVVIPFPTAQTKH